MSTKLLAVTMAVMLAFGFGAVAQQEDTQRQDQQRQEQIRQLQERQDQQRQTQPGQSQGQQDRQGQVSEEQFLNKLHAANLKEIELSKLVLAKSDNVDLMLFAVQLMRDHQKADAKVKEIAKANNVQLSEPQWARSQTGASSRTSAAQRPDQSQSETAQERIEQLQREQKAQQGQQDQPGQRGVSAQTPASQRPGSSTYEDDAQQTFARLEGMDGEKFDREFVKIIAESHKKLISSVNQSKGQIQDKKIHQLCEQLEPTMRLHAERAEQLAKQFDESPRQTERERT